MSWPIASSLNASPFVGYEGSLPTTLAWGTDGLYSGVIVKSLRSSQLIEEITIENGSGIVSTQVLLLQGREIEINVVDDRSVTFPVGGAVATLLDPLPNGSGATSTNFIVVNNNYNAARKVEGERTLMCKRYNNITPATMA